MFDKHRANHPFLFSSVFLFFPFLVSTCRDKTQKVTNEIGQINATCTLNETYQQNSKDS